MEYQRCRGGERGGERRGQRGGEGAGAFGGKGVEGADKGDEEVEEGVGVECGLASGGVLAGSACYGCSAGGWGGWGGVEGEGGGGVGGGGKDVGEGLVSGLVFLGCGKGRADSG